MGPHIYCLTPLATVHAVTEVILDWPWATRVDAIKTSDRKLHYAACWPATVTVSGRYNISNAWRQPIALTDHRQRIIAGGI